LTKDTTARSGATGATVFALQLRPGARKWFMQYLGRHHPELIDAYAELCQNGSNITRSYATDLARRSSVLLRKHGLDRKQSMRRIPDTSTAAVPPHLALSELSLF
jgi:hypothetical protein